MRRRGVSCYFRPGGGGSVTVGTVTLTVVTGVETVTGGGATVVTVGTVAATPPTVVVVLPGSGVVWWDPDGAWAAG
jgi:hypothetical protein